MPTCLVEGCNGISLQGDVCALCANTRPVKKLTQAVARGRERDEKASREEASRTNPDAFVSLMCVNGQSKPHEKFALACQDYGDRLFALLAKGKPNGSPESVHGCMVHHDTQPSANRTVFFDWRGVELRIFGVGNHTGGDGSGNDSYEFTWFDGKSKNYTR